MSPDRDNPARPGAGALLARLEDLPDPGAVAVEFAAGEARFSLILARRGGEVFAYENRCPHAEMPLDRPDGRVAVAAGRFLICAMHGASFALETGACVGGPGAGAGLIPAPLDVKGGEIRLAALAVAPTD